MTDQSTGTGLLHRLGHFCARHARGVLVAWLVLALGLLAADRALAGTYTDDFSLPRTSAQSGLDLLRVHDAKAGGYASKIVMQAPAGTLADRRDAVEQAVTNLAGLPHVIRVSDPFAGNGGSVSTDGRVAVLTISFTDNPGTYGHPYLRQVDDAVAVARDAGVQVDYGGQLGQAARPKANDRRSEVIGVVVALAVLLIGFGSLAAAGLPLLSALIGVAAGAATLGLVATAIEFASVSPTLAVMMALGVGIDYALFLTTRYRRAVADGADPIDAAADTTARSGRAVLTAAVTVIVALIGLYASGVSFIGRLGLAAGIAVAVAALAALTLTPALLGWTGRNIDRWYVRRPT
ncbi:MAG TPA: MMPL family transporter, partial [Rugosimonospora sp.]|nr:MMPL family transporter [Rugosimonospora sp.]